MIKLKDDYVKYYIDEEKGIVVCRINPWAATSYMDKTIKAYSSNKLTGKFLRMHCDNIWSYCFGTIPNDNQLFGKAVCLPEDTFNVNTGKRIAKEKLKVKLFNHVTKQIVDIVKGGALLLASMRVVDEYDE